jgi:hypothetical protein
MSITHSIRLATIAALGVLATLWGEAGAAPPPDAVEGLKTDAAEVLEVQVQEVHEPQGQGEGFEVHYRMEVLSVLRSASRIQPGETITVRSSGPSNEALGQGWIGTAYLNRDPKASGPDAGRQFVTAAEGDSLMKLPPGPPSLRFTPMAPESGQ